MPTSDFSRRSVPSDSAALDADGRTDPSGNAPLTPTALTNFDRLLIFLPAILQVLILAKFGLGVDEAHYMVYARHLDLSYFDHPPLVGWVHAAFNLVFGETLLSARLPAILIGAYSSYQAFRFLQSQGFAERAAAWAAFALGICFEFFVLHLFLLPDTLCFALFWPLMRATIAVSERPNVREWARLGLLLGLMGLAKYTAVFFVVPVAAILLPTFRFRILKQRGLYVGVLIALLLIAPILIWNAQRDWISFKYQGAHVLGGESGIRNVLQTLVGQFMLYSPFLFPVALWGFARMWRERSKAVRFAVITALTYIVFFLLSSYRAVVLPHWTAMFYIVALPWGIASLWIRHPRWVMALTGATTAVIGTLSFLLVTEVGYRIPGALREVSGWPTVMTILADKAGEQGAVAFSNWTYGSRALFYGRAIESRVFVLDDRHDQFDLWNSGSFDGRDLWLAQFSYDEEDVTNKITCESWGEKQRLPISVEGVVQYDLIIQKCAGAKAIPRG